MVLIKKLKRKATIRVYPIFYFNLRKETLQNTKHFELRNKSVDAFTID